jgi:hypothetical protein
MIQDIIVYNISNKHKIEAGNFRWKLNNKIKDYFRKKNIIQFISLEELQEKKPNLYATI